MFTEGKNRRKNIEKRSSILDVKYKDVIFEKRFKADILVEDSVIVELKAQKSVTEIDEAQLLNYLKVTDLRVGLLFNFGSEKLEKLRRVI